MIISLASDHAGFVLKQKICFFLANNGITAVDRGVMCDNDVDYPDYVPYVVNDVLLKRCDFGILICATGIGMNIMANRYAGIRAGLCCDTKRAIAARKHNNINVLCIGANFITLKEAENVVSMFINTKFGGDERHIRRINKFNDLGEKRDKNRDKNVF